MLRVKNTGNGFYPNCRSITSNGKQICETKSRTRDHVTAPAKFKALASYRPS